MRGLAAALSFLTRVPVPVRAAGPGDLASSVPWFPVVGGMIGLGIGAAHAVALQALGGLAAAALAVSGGMLLTGAFHEDGLADAFDALGGGWSAEESLEIMRDSRLGTFGVAALVSSLLVRVGLISGFDGRTALWVLPAAHAVSRAAAVGVMGTTSSAAGEGLGASYLAGVTRNRALAGLLAGGAIGLGVLGPSIGGAAMASAAVVAFVVRRWSLGRIGGVTGDVLGAVQQVSELAVLAVAAGMAGAGFESW